MTARVDSLRGARVGVALCSGFFGFFHHAGVLEALAARGIRPARIAGNSAGAIVGAMYAAGLEPAEISRELLSVRRADFWDPGWPFTRSGLGFLAGERFAARLARALPVHGFAECRTPLAVGAYGIDDGRTRHLGEGPLVPAVHASCAVPYMFQPVEIGGRRYWDGGFGEKTPLAPFIKARDVDAVVVSYLPPRDAAAKKRRGALALLPRLSSLFAAVPADERLERDRAAVAILRESGVRVLVLGPPPVRLGPFSLERGAEAVRAGREGASSILDSKGDAPIGTEWLA
ncbi:MAG: patatin-like phospholipase family protein [Proteobacteria bacterium]|jgi:NTE family protein|nr:patatin-like phospholipase family protein [Pseudomonadota bacterium]